jgi:hypothetical protein
MKKNKCCYIDCKEKAIGCYRIDIDVSPLYYCEKHKDNVMNSFMFALFGEMELSNKMLGLKNKKKKNV